MRKLIYLIIAVAIILVVVLFVVKTKKQHETNNPVHVEYIKNNTLPSAKYDTIIRTDIYASYYSYEYKAPIFVSYTLFHGGGDCDRKHFHFINDCRIPSACKKDYAATGYDEGHLVPAEDFAYDCKFDEETFRFYNCVPQTKELNRGSWKHWETLIRKESQHDSLFIICGNVFSTAKMGDDIGIPSYCYKVVEDIPQKSILYVVLCQNSGTAICDTLSLPVLEKTIGYQLPVLK